MQFRSFAKLESFAKSTSQLLVVNNARISKSPPSFNTSVWVFLGFEFQSCLITGGLLNKSSHFSKFCGTFHNFSFCVDTICVLIFRTTTKATLPTPLNHKIKRMRVKKRPSKFFSRPSALKKDRVTTQKPKFTKRPFKKHHHPLNNKKNAFKPSPCPAAMICVQSKLKFLKQRTEENQFYK